MTRADLLALTDESLAALTNRGLVKRAVKDPAPEVTADADGTVVGRYADGTTTTLPAGAALPSAVCTCSATGVCRHVVGVVLAYRHAAEAATATAAPDPASDTAPAPLGDTATVWSPAAFTDDDLVAGLGARAVAAARRSLRTGYVAQVHPGTADTPPSVQLPSCSVQFLVRGELGYVHTDAVAAKRDEAVVLAVWACRAAVDAGAAPGVHLQVGGSAGDGVAGTAAAVELADIVLRDGVRHCAASMAATVARARAGLAAGNLCWPVAAVDELAGQLAHWTGRDAAYSAARAAALLAELHARHRAATGGGATPLSRVLGTDERAETPLRRVSLTGLGARVSGDDRGGRTVETFLADDSAALVLVLRRRWNDDPDVRVVGHDLGRRRVGGARIADLAVGTVVTESARRSASRELRIASNQVARTTVTRGARGWHALSAGLVVTDFAAAAATLAGLAPRLVRPRVEAEFVRVLQIADVVEVAYDPGAQRLDATVVDAAGEPATVTRTYDPVAPGALDVLDALLQGSRGVPRSISGALTREHGALVLDPLAVLVDDGVVVPDLEPGDGSAALALGDEVWRDPLTVALDAAGELLADLAHEGLDHLRPAHRDRVGRVAGELRGVGLGTLAGTVAVLTDPEPGTWATAQIRLLTTREAR